MRKVALNSGQETIDYRGRPRPARQTGPDCRCSRFECFSKVDLETRNDILTDFNAMGEYNAQNVYLRGLVEARDIKRLGPGGRLGVVTEGKKRTKKCSYVYFVQGRRLNRTQVWLLYYTI